MVHDLDGMAFVDAVEKFKARRRSFYLDPERWDGSRVDTDLDWQVLKFEPGNRDHVPEERGVYAFVVKRENGHFPPHGYIMYIGITGHQAAQRTLRKRFGDYLREKNKNKRPRVHFMLNRYESDLYFFFVPIDENVDLAKLEIDLNDAIVPPVGRKDFSASIKALRDALND
ncbi:MAG: hypothetical protein AB7P52_05125 [Alphaproteobacteria bacterium]